MAAARKTVKVAELVATANSMLEGHAARNGDGDTAKDQRQGIIALTTSLLHGANAYKGFRYANGWHGEDETDETDIRFLGAST